MNPTVIRVLVVVTEVTERTMGHSLIDVDNAEVFNPPTHTPYTSREAI
jgi:hypothetical protein